MFYWIPQKSKHRRSIQAVFSEITTPSPNPQILGNRFVQKQKICYRQLRLPERPRGAWRVQESPQRIPESPRESPRETPEIPKRAPKSPREFQRAPEIMNGQQSGPREPHRVRASFIITRENPEVRLCFVFLLASWATLGPGTVWACLSS
mgnify:CR=1 FL=1